MSKNDSIFGIYSVEQPVMVVDKQSEYVDRTGFVARLGAAGDLIYYHVQLSGMSTVLTFTEKQLRAVVKD